MPTAPGIRKSRGKPVLVHSDDLLALLESVGGLLVRSRGSIAEPIRAQVFDHLVPVLAALERAGLINADINALREGYLRGDLS